MSLRTTPREARRIIAETEGHLRESARPGCRRLAEREVQEAALSSFGSAGADLLPEGFVPTVSACLFAVQTWVGINTTSSGMNGGPGAPTSAARSWPWPWPSVSFPYCGARCCATPAADPPGPPAPAVPPPRDGRRLAGSVRPPDLLPGEHQRLTSGGK